MTSLGAVEDWAHGHDAAAVANLGPAPYGNGTLGLLVVGRAREKGRRAADLGADRHQGRDRRGGD
ncbi:hypothetical protein BH23ACT2_BH23ACT2_28590 [soil metagenome]